MTQPSSASSDTTAPGYLGMPLPQYFLIYSWIWNFPEWLRQIFHAPLLPHKPEQLMQCPSASGFSGVR